MKAVEEIRSRKTAGEPEVVDLENENEDVVKKKRVTFLIEYEKCSLAIEDVVKALEFIANINIDTTPKGQLERVIKILVSVCVDLNNQMQTAQTTMGAMSELIEDLLKSGENVEALNRSNKKLRVLVADLREQVEQYKKYNKHLVSFNRPEEHQKEALKNLIEIKMVNEDLEKQVKSLKEAYRERNERYEESYRWQASRKAEIESLSIKLKNEQALRI